MGHQWVFLLHTLISPILLPATCLKLYLFSYYICSTISSSLSHSSPNSLFLVSRLLQALHIWTQKLRVIKLVSTWEKCGNEHGPANFYTLFTERREWNQSTCQPTDCMKGQWKKFIYTIKFYSMKKKWFSGEWIKPGKHFMKLGKPGNNKTV